MSDDELTEALGEALLEDVPSRPDPERLAALRTRAEELRSGALPAAPPVALSSRSRSIRWLAVAAVVAAVAFGLGALVGSRGGDDGDKLADGVVEYSGDIAGPDGSAGTLVVTKLGIGRLIELDTDDLEILPTGDYYEVWFVGSDDAPGSLDRISAGTFHPDDAGRSDVVFTAAVDPTSYPRIEVTVEPGDGDPSPSGVVALELTIGG